MDTRAVFLSTVFAEEFVIVNEVSLCAVRRVRVYVKYPWAVISLRCVQRRRLNRAQSYPS